MRKKYVACMNEYITLDHMREVSKGCGSQPHYYIPHNVELNPSSTTMSQRTIFNASMKTGSGLLNDILYTRPVVHVELIAILMCFRLFQYVVSTYIVKMYRQIVMHPLHRVFQRIFWRDSPKDKLKEYELITLNFGEQPAPYLATRGLKELAVKYGATFVNAVAAILIYFYIDNALHGSNSLEQALATQEELITLLNFAGFQLSKWCANTPKLF